jgi:hypothetical protein
MQRRCTAGPRLPNGSCAGRTCWPPVPPCSTWPAAPAGTCSGSPGAAMRSPASTGRRKRSRQPAPSGAPSRRTSNPAPGLSRPGLRRGGRHQLPLARPHGRHRGRRGAGRRAALRDLRGRQRDAWASRRGPTSCCSPANCSRPVPDLRVVAYEDGFLPEPARFVQRIAAIRPAPSAAGGPALPPSSRETEGPTAAVWRGPE